MTDEPPLKKHATLDNDNNYRFPGDKLSKKSSNQTPVVLVECGSFSPVTLMHLRLLGKLFCRLDNYFSHNFLICAIIRAMSGSLSDGEKL